MLNQMISFTVGIDEKISDVATRPITTRMQLIDVLMQKRKMFKNVCDVATNSVSCCKLWNDPIEYEVAHIAGLVQYANHSNTEGQSKNHFKSLFGLGEICDL